MDKLTAAKVFVDVATSKSFTATADRLEISRPMVTRYIEAMEKWLNTRLLHRTTRKIALTTAGEQCLKDVERWLAQAQHIEALADVSNELSGTVRLATSMSFGYSQLVPPLTQFMKQHKNVSIDIDLHDSVTNLADSQIDLAIRIASNPEPSLIGKPIGICRSIIVASPQYLAANSPINEPSDLSVHECLGYKNFQRHVWHLSKGQDFVSQAVRCRLTANEATTLLIGALNGAGLAMQPTYLVQNYLTTGQLVRVLPDWQPNDLTIYALYSSRKHLSATVRALIDYLAAYFAKQTW
jgi:DNA-binding transcriptional LysR family regulator